MKTIKKIFLVLLGLVLVIVLAVFAFYQFENYTGRKAWDQYVKECGGWIEGIEAVRRPAVEALEKSGRFGAPKHIRKVAEPTKPFLSIGNQYGEGWFLCGEMVELLEEGVNNIVCIQPFACLPNHVMGKGVIKALKKAYPKANIAAVDYDPGASEVNQLNRLKLMLTAARRELAEERRDA